MVTMLIGVLAALTSQDAPPGSLNGSGSISSREYKDEIREGNRVIATEWLSLTYTVTWKMVDTGEGVSEAEFLCANECEGKKHPNHASCDTSCDEECRTSHDVDMRGKFVRRTAEMRKAEKDANRCARESGGTTDPADWTYSWTNSLSAARRWAERQRFQGTLKHWETRPCARTTHWYGLRKFLFRVTGTFTRNIRRMERGVTTTRTEPGKSHSANVAELWVPQREPIHEIDHGVTCNCKVTDTVSGKVIGNPPNRTPTFSGLGLRRPDGTLIFEGFPPGVSVVIIGKNLNRVTCKVTNQTGETITLIFFPGTSCTPSNGAYQSMVIVGTLNAQVPPSGALYFDMPVASGPAANVFEGDARAACAEIEKKEPNSSVTFTPKRAPSDALRNIAYITDRAAFRGPHDQARLWIYTDVATFDDINKRLVPGVTAGQYVNAMHDLARILAVDFASGKHKRCMDAGLLTGATAREEAVQWFVDTMTLVDAKALARFAGSAASKFKTLLSGSPDKFDVQHTAHLARALCAGDNEDVRMAGLKFVLNAVPEGKRQDLVAAGVFDHLVENLNSPSAEEALLAIDVALAYSWKDAAPTLHGVAEWSKHDGVKQKAADAAAKLDGA